jgi:hypothetical protein
MKRNFKRVLAIGDTHCGHVVGLTPPQWWFHRTGDKYHDKYVKIQRQMWNWFVKELAPLKPIDRVIFNGDAIEGKGLRSGGTELITSDRIRQGEMFKSILEEIDCNEVAMTYGTPSHTGTDEDMEDVIEKVLKQDFSISIESHLEREIAGVRFDARHFISGSGIPHGRYTPLAREDLWRLIWADRSEKFAPHITLRSHVHYHGFCGNEFSLMMTLPCFQGLGSKFGSRLCSGTVSLGFVIFDCEDGKYTWQSRIIPLKNQVSEWKSW